MTEIIFQLDEELMMQSLNNNDYKPQPQTTDDNDYFNYSTSYFNNNTSDYFNVYNGIDDILDIPEQIDNEDNFDYHHQPNFTHQTLSPIPELSSSIDSIDSMMYLEHMPGNNAAMPESDAIAGSNYIKWLQI